MIDSEYMLEQTPHSVSVGGMRRFILGWVYYNVIRFCQILKMGRKCFAYDE